MGVKLEKRSKNTKIMALSFVCTMLMCFILAIFAGLAPFGDNTLVISDSASQYTSFWAYLRAMLKGEQDPFYALEMTMGNNVTGLMGYYCISPFNLLFLLFPISKMPLAIHLILMLKLCFSSLFMSFFFKNSQELSLKSLIFTTAYAFCGYILSYSWCLMWLDGFMLLPLIALGLKHISNGKKPWLYIFSLGGAIICNYYIGFMLCIFSVLYFISLLISSGGKPKFRTLSSFALSSLCAGSLSAFVILPALMSMQNGKRIPFSELLKQQLDTFSDFFISKLPQGLQNTAFSSVFPFVLVISAVIVCGLMVFFCTRKRINIKIRIGVFTLFTISVLAYGAIYESNGFFMQKLLIGFADSAEMTNGYPAIYSGIFPLMMAVYFFISDKPNRHRKLSAAFLLLTLIFSMHFKVPNMVWHGFTTNSMFNYRYSFIFSFVLISLGEEAFCNLNSFSLKQAGKLTAFAVALLILAKASPKTLAGNSQYLFVLLEVVFICLLLYFIFNFSGNKYVKNGLWTALALCCTVSVVWQGVLGLKKLCGDESMSDFQAEVSELEAKALSIKGHDQGLYRANIGTRINAPMMCGYNGMSHFSSNEETTVVDFMKKMGVASYENIWSSVAFGRTSALDTFFGIKYTTEPDNLPMYQKLSSDIYQTENVFPLVFTADRTVLSTDINSPNPFVNQNRLFKSACPQGQDIFTPPDLVVKEYHNLESTSHNEYKLVDKSKDGIISYSYRATGEDAVYFYNAEFKDHSGKLYMNGKYVSDMSSEFDCRTIYLGRFEAGEEFTLELVLESGSEGTLGDDVYVSHENAAVLKDYSKLVSGRAGETISDTDSHIITKLNVGSDDQYLLYTIPYSKAWHINVDGNKTEAQKAFGLMLAVPLQAGEHTIEIKFVPPGLYAGTIISGLSLLSVLTAVIITGRKKKV